MLRFAVVLALAGCVAQFKAAVIALPETFYPMGEHSGRTICAMNGVPLIIVNPKVIGTIAEPLTLAHEEVHVQQLYHYKGGCIEGMKAYTTDKNVAVAWETQAYCATLAKAVAMELDITRFREVIREALRKDYNVDLNCDEQGTAQSVLGINRR